MNRHQTGFCPHLLAIYGYDEVLNKASAHTSYTELVLTGAYWASPTGGSAAGGAPTHAGGATAAGPAQGRQQGRISALSYIYVLILCSLFRSERYKSLEKDAPVSMPASAMRLRIRVACAASGLPANLTNQSSDWPAVTAPCTQ